jgi:hypothetical protein
MESQRTVKFFGIWLGNKTNPGDTRLQAPVDEGNNDLRANPDLPVLREDHEILNIAIGNTIGNYAAHADGLAGLGIHRNSKGKTAPYEIAEFFAFIFLLPPSPGLIEGSYFFFVPCMDKLNRNVICHKQSYPVLLFKQFPDTYTEVLPSEHRLKEPFGRKSLLSRVFREVEM